MRVDILRYYTIVDDSHPEDGWIFEHYEGMKETEDEIELGAQLIPSLLGMYPKRILKELTKEEYYEIYDAMED